MIRYDDGMPSDGELFQAITWDDYTRLAQGTYFEIDENSRLYYQVHKEHKGFSFCYVEFFSCPFPATTPWNNLEFQVERVCSGWALFDGIRHMWMPYVHYPNLNNIVRILTYLIKLQEEHCEL